MGSKYGVTLPGQPKPRGDAEDMVGSVTPNDIHITTDIPYRKDSEDNFGVGSNICGSNDVLCSSSDILSNIFPCLSNFDNENTSPIAPQKANSIVGRFLDLTPSTTPVRRGRFLVWPAALGCDDGLKQACAALPILSSSSSSE
jgi:hypothetical protein